jgi:pimeloyl-ACP methyl ester carboxylesterase
MSQGFRAWLAHLRPDAYRRKPSLVLVNGLAEQAETWFRNRRHWSRHFDVHTPNLLAYDGEVLHQRIHDDLPISVDYLVDQLHIYLRDFVQAPPYHFVASSLGGKVVVEFAARYPELVNRIVLLCPSGMGDTEQLPLIEGVRRSDLRSLVDSVFFDRRKVDPGLVAFYSEQFRNKRWRSGLLRTVRGTMTCSVRERMALVQAPTLFISGREDRIVDSDTARLAAHELPNGQFLMIPRCGHAPHLEKPWTLNRLVVRFLNDARPTIRRRSEPVLSNPTAAR